MGLNQRFEPCGTIPTCKHSCLSLSPPTRRQKSASCSLPVVGITSLQVSGNPSLPLVFSLSLSQPGGAIEVSSRPIVLSFPQLFLSLSLSFYTSLELECSISRFMTRPLNFSRSISLSLLLSLTLSLSLA